MWKFSDCSSCCAWIFSLLEAGDQLLLAEFDVLRRGHGRHQAGFLIDHADTGGERIARPLEIDELAVDVILAGGQLDGAGDRLAERRLAGAILADQPVNLAGIEIEIDVFDGMHAAIDLAAVHDAKHRLLVDGSNPGDGLGGGYHFVHARPPDRSSRHATAALGHDHQTLRRLARGGDAVITAADPAVQALHRVAFLIDARDQSRRNAAAPTASRCRAP